MRITFTELIDFLGELNPDNTERTKAGKLLGPYQRAILARFDDAMLDRVRTVIEWQRENLEAMRSVKADIDVILDAHGLLPYADDDPMLKRLPEHARIFVEKQLHLFSSLKITGDHFQNLNVAEPDLGYSELP